MLELAHGLPQPAGDLWQLFPPEEDQRQEQDNDQFLRGEDVGGN
jgi:hypothetical protein